MKKRKRIVLLVMLAMLVMIMPLSASAATKKTKALKAYKSFLAKNVSKFTVTAGDFSTKNKESSKKTSEFNIVDLDGNGVPELVCWHPVGYKKASIYVYTYTGGKVTKLKKGTISLGWTAGGYYIVFICQNKHLHVHYYNNWVSVSEEYMYQAKSGKLVKKSALSGCTSAKELVANTAAKRKKILS